MKHKFRRWRHTYNTDIPLPFGKRIKAITYKRKQGGKSTTDRRSETTVFLSLWPPGAITKETSPIFRGPFTEKKKQTVSCMHFKIGGGNRFEKSSLFTSHFFAPSLPFLSQDTTVHHAPSPHLLSRSGDHLPPRSPRHFQGDRRPTVDKHLPKNACKLEEGPAVTRPNRPLVFLRLGVISGWHRHRGSPITGSLTVRSPPPPTCL